MACRAAEASVAPVNGRAIMTASPNLTTEVQYWGYPAYSNWGYPRYSTVAGERGAPAEGIANLSDAEAAAIVATDREMAATCSRRPREATSRAGPSSSR
jgi:hypothetical protein